MQEPSDESLMLRIANNDKEAFELLLARHLDAIHRYGYRLANNWADADDLSQETFARVWSRAHKYKPSVASVSTWMHRIAHNLFVDQHRKSSRNSALDEASEPTTESNTTAQYDAATMLNSLPTEQRSAMILCTIQGFSNAEAAHILNTSVRAVESLLSRARRSLRKRYAD